MPTERFYNLSQQKREKIKNAIIQELIRVPYESMSINRIIRSASISRGSFYTYFQDKRDSFTYVLYGIREDMWNICRDSLKRSEGNFWMMMRDLLTGSIEYCERYGYSTLLESTFSNPALIRICHESLQPSVEIWNDIYNRINKGQFRQESKEELLVLTRIGLELLIMIQHEYYTRTLTLEEAIYSLDVRMNMIRHGVCA